jgi:hypothetical protein
LDGNGDDPRVENQGGRSWAFRALRDQRPTIPIGLGPQTNGTYAHGRAQEEMIARDFVRPAHASSALQNPPDVRLRATRRRRNVAHARRPEPLLPPEQRRNNLPSRHVLGNVARASFKRGADGVRGGGATEALDEDPSGSRI